VVAEGDGDGCGDVVKVVVEGEAVDSGESFAITWTRGGRPGTGTGGFGRGRSRTER
jgi:hypothetical protein